MKTYFNSSLLVIFLLPNLVVGQGFFGSFDLSAIIKALEGLREALAGLGGLGSLFPSTPTPEVKTPTIPMEGFDTSKAETFIADAFKGLLENLGEGFVPDCDSLVSDAIPSMSEVSDFESGLPKLFELLIRNLCETEPTTQESPELVDELIATPLETFLNSLRVNGERRRRTEEKRNLQTSSDNLQCVERFAEGDLNGFLGRPPVFEGVRGGTNQYAWGTGFNEEVGFGVIVHSTGTSGAVSNEYSLPTFTVRNRDSEIVFQGVLAFPDQLGGVVVGIRSASVLNAETIGDDTVITVIGATVELQRGKFLEFKFSTKEYAENGFNPIFGIEPTRSFEFETPSVRSFTQLTPELAFYAGSNDFSFDFDFSNFRFFDLVNWTNVGPKIFPSAEGRGRLPGVLWDFECSFEDDGLCFVNTIEFEFGDPEEFLDEETIPVTSFFPRSSIPVNLVNQPTDSEVDLAVTIVANDFDITYSAQSFEPIDAKTSAVCTLSGFLFAGGTVFANPGASIPDGSVVSSLADFRSTLEFLQLGDGQQCNICTGSISSPARRNLRTLELTENTCTLIELENQPVTTAYVWAVEECGGQIFVGTYDIGSVLAELILDTFIDFTARSLCSRNGVVLIACSLSGGRCGLNPFINQGICAEGLSAAIRNALSDERRIRFAVDLASDVFETEVTPNDLGFDLYVASKADILSGTATSFRPITQNGFRELSPAIGLPNIGFQNEFGFDPSSQIDEAIRNMSCQKGQSGDTLIVGSAVFGLDASSNTYEVDPDCIVRVQQQQDF